MSGLTDLLSISFCDVDPTTVEADILSTYEKVAETTLYPGDPVRLFLEGIAYLIAQQRYVIDWSAKQNLLAYSTGSYLDHLGALTKCTRLEAAAATCTLRFAIGAVRDTAVIIPAGTRATPDGTLMFATTEAASIAAGDLIVDIEAACTTTGSAGSGFIAGQISSLVDAVDGVTSVTNTTTSYGGSDVESDSNYQGRVWLSPESFSAAGPTGAYEYWAKTAHQDIIDVEVIRPIPGVVRIVPLMVDGVDPSSEILAAIATLCNATKVRPINDQVVVAAPGHISYAINLVWYAQSSMSTVLDTIQSAVAAAVSEYVTWQKSQLNRDITPSKLVALVQAVSGVARVDCTSPVVTDVPAGYVASETATTVSYGGLIDG